MRPLLALLFLLVPLVEIWLILQVGQVIGAPGTLLALVAISIAGAVLVKREGLKAWRRFRDALAEARVPATEVVDGALLLVAGALLVTPGFLTDGVGFLLLVPATRVLVNRALRTRVRRAFGLGPGDRRDTGARRPPPARGEVVDIEVVDVERSDGDDDAAPGAGPGPR